MASRRGPAPCAQPHWAVGGGMSLVGSLEDLSLGDILQIISLSQKSGVLSLQTKGNGGRIVFVDGLVRGASLNDGPADLRGVLVGGGFLADSEFGSAREHAAAHGCGLAPAVVATTSLSGERIDSLCRETVECAVVTMFSWATGDFSFDMHGEFESGDPELLLPTGINAEYLAMEGARLHDESSRGGGDESTASVTPTAEPESVDPRGFDEMSAHELFGAAPEIDLDDVPDEVPDPALLEAEPLEDEGVLDLVEGDVIAEPDPLDVDAVAVLPEAGIPAESSGEVELPPHDAPGQVAAAGAGSLVAMDDDLLALEWVKGVVKTEYSPVHIFQQTDQGLARIRQYLVRGEPPVVLISPTMQVDSLGGISSTADFIFRLKNQSPRLKAFWLTEDGAVAPPLSPADGTLTRPDGNRLRFDGKSASLERLADDFRVQLCGGAESVPPQDVSGADRGAHDTGKGTVSPDPLGRLRDVTKALTEAASRGEVLPLVIRFAAEIFSRVAMFMVRDGTAVGMAQHGLDRCGGPGDSELREVCFDVASSGWMSAVLEQGRAVEGTPSDDGDYDLVRLLGDRIPGSAYVAPIESSGQVIALLYGDNLPEDTPVGDTSALEVVLHHAGLALERAVLERALREVDADSGTGCTS